MKNIMIAMSGGVDSAVTAMILKENARIAGVTMRLLFPGRPDPSGSERDCTDAAAACRAMGIPHYIADLGDEFFSCVVKPFIESYQNGQTPNPCVLCNEKIKFGALLRFAREKGFDTLATGHYARVEKDANGRFLLRRSKDLTKDQTYVLYTLSQQVLSSVCFPLGELSKKEVRERAALAGLKAAERVDSQDICFLPDGDYAGFIEKELGKPQPPGNFLSPDGRVLGKHKGLIHYTIGQRKGLGIAAAAPLYVLRKSKEDNTVTLGDNAALFTRRVKATDIHFIPFDKLQSTLRVMAKVRYRQTAARATVEQTGTNELILRFDEPQRAVSPGQSLVLYDEHDDYVIGGGKIIE